MKHAMTSALEGYALVDFLNAKDFNSARTVVAGSEDLAGLVQFMADLTTDLWNTVVCECTCEQSAARVATGVMQSRLRAIREAGGVALHREAHDS